MENSEMISYCLIHGFEFSISSLWLVAIKARELYLPSINHIAGIWRMDGLVFFPSSKVNATDKTGI